MGDVVHAPVSFLLTGGAVFAWSGQQLLVIEASFLVLNNQSEKVEHVSMTQKGSRTLAADAFAAPWNAG